MSDDNVTEPIVMPDDVQVETAVEPIEEIVAEEPVDVIEERVIIPDDPVLTDVLDIPNEPVEVIPDDPVIRPATTVVESESDFLETGVESLPLLKKDVEDNHDVESLTVKSKHDMNLSEMLIDFLRVDRNKIELTPKLKQMIVILPLMKSSEDTISHLENIELLLTKIVADKQINVLDMGEIIELLKEMYIIYDTIMRMKVTADEVEKVFKFLVQVFVQYKLGNHISDEEKELIIRSIFTILTLCTQMIDLKETTKTLKKKIKFCPCF